MKKDFEKLLKQFTAIPSVSADIACQKSINDASEFLQTFAKKSGMEVKIIKGFDNPIVIAKTKLDKTLKTVLIYGHYDVQPAKKSDGWKTEPFVLTKVGNKLYGRGSTDNKGQVLMHLYTVAQLIKENGLGYNIIFLIEGNEETGSPSLRKFIEKYKKELTCDYVVISDGNMNANDIPALEESFRGSVNVDISFVTAKDDLHSGLFGGSVPNASEELALFISKLHDSNKNILVPGFYSGLKENGKVTKALKNKLTKLTGTKIVFAKNNSEYESLTGLKPALEVTGINSGYSGIGFKNSIPARATAKINLRSAPNQNPEMLVSALKQFILKNVSKHVVVKIVPTDSSTGAVLETKNEFAKKARMILKNVYKKEPTLKHSGGTLPIVNDFKEVLKVPQIMIPLANEDCGMHSASENITLNAITKGLEFSYKLLSK